MRTQTRKREDEELRWKGGMNDTLKWKDKNSKQSRNGVKLMMRHEDTGK